MNFNETKGSEAQQIPAALSEYLTALDLSPSGTAAQDLDARAAAEALRVDEIPLSPITGPHPPHVTPEMLTWYQTFVAAKRGLALNSVASPFRERTEKGKGEGFLLQTKLGDLEEKDLADKLKCYKDHSEKYDADYKKIERTETEIQDDLHQYNVRKAQLGRDAKVLNRWLYFGVLFFVVFGAEAMINFESFAALTWATPAIAFGMTLLTGLGIGIAAHLHGTLLKQFAYYFGKAEDDEKRGPAWRMMIGGLVCLLLCLGLVYYARSAYLLAFLGSGFGQTGSNLSTFWVIGGSILGNLIVYLVGVMWAYLLHDYDPKFSDLKKKLDEETTEVEGQKRKLTHLRQREKEQLDAKFRLKSDEIHRAYSLIKSQPELAWPLELFRKFQSKDEEVLALLQRYRGLLIQKMGPAAKKTKFRVCSDNPYVKFKLASSDEYQGMRLKLKFVEEH